MSGLKLVLFIVWCGSSFLVEGYPAGPPPEACDTMDPSAGHKKKDGSAATTQMLDTSPYTILIDNSTFSSTRSLKITLKGSEEIEGFFVQARSAANMGTRVGVFGTTGGKYRGYKCANSQVVNALSQKAEIEDAKVINDILWTAPANSKELVTFYATFVKDEDKFWVKVKSNNISLATGIITTQGGSGGKASEATTVADDTSSAGRFTLNHGLLVAAAAGATLRLF